MLIQRNREFKQNERKGRHGREEEIVKNTDEQENERKGSNAKRRNSEEHRLPEGQGLRK